MASGALSLDQQVLAVSLAFDGADNLEGLTSRAHRGAFDTAPRLDSVLDARERFQLWSTNLGAARPQADPRSLLHRLRNAPMVQRRIVEILHELSELLFQIDEPSKHDTNTDREMDSEDEELLGELRQMTTSSEAQCTWIIRSICDAVTRLFNMARLIARSTATDRYARAQASQHDKFTSQIDTLRIKDKFQRGQVTEWLVIRLGQANASRRQYFKYCREHVERISTGQSCTRSNSNVLRKDIANPLQTPPTVLGKRRGASLATEGKSEALTKATTVVAARADEPDDGFDDISLSSKATSIGSGDAVDKIDFPSLSAFATAGEDFECPYCHQTQRFNGQRGFRKHVEKDLRPYICTFEECGLLMFDSRHAWAEHEMKQHRRRWICPRRGCKTRYHANRDQLADHLLSTHADTYGLDELDLILDTSSRPLEDIQATVCPFCDWESRLRPHNLHIQSDAPITVSARKFMRHLADHMEQIALFALPRRLPEAASSLAAGLDHDDSLGHSLSSADACQFESLPAMAILGWTVVFAVRWRRACNKGVKAGSTPLPSDRMNEQQTWICCQCDCSNSPSVTSNACPQCAHSKCTRCSEEDSILCVCGYEDDDGCTVECESCARWQHQTCYYPEYDDSPIPESLEHYCVRCRPRLVDTERARMRQQQKRMSGKKVYQTKTLKTNPAGTDVPISAQAEEPSKLEEDPESQKPAGKVPAARAQRRHVNKYGFTRLAEACESGDLRLVRHWLREDPGQLEVAEFAGNKPVQIAALNGHVEIVDHLIQQGCQIHCKNVDGDTPLIDAAENGHSKVVSRLLHAGVDPVQKNLKGQQALDLITDDVDDAESIRTAIRGAIERHDIGARQIRETEEKIAIAPRSESAMNRSRQMRKEDLQQEAVPSVQEDLQTFSALRAPEMLNPFDSLRQSNPAMELFRTESQAFQDELYNPNIVYTSPPARTSINSLATQSHMREARLETADAAGFARVASAAQNPSADRDELPGRDSTSYTSHSDASLRSVLSSVGEKAKLGFQNEDGSWSCSYPGCQSRSTFHRGCDLRKHYKRHTKVLFCRHSGCPQAMEGGFSSEKDRARHEAKHNPSIPCEWEGCERLFSRHDNMKDHVRRVHLRRSNLRIWRRIRRV